jgi:hypothetical protein
MLFAFGFYLGLWLVFFLWAFAFGFLVWGALEGKTIIKGKRMAKGKLLKGKEQLKRRG